MHINILTLILFTLTSSFALKQRRPIFYEIDSYKTVEEINYTPHMKHLIMKFERNSQCFRIVAGYVFPKELNTSDSTYLIRKAYEILIRHHPKLIKGMRNFPDSKIKFLCEKNYSTLRLDENKITFRPNKFSFVFSNGSNILILSDFKHAGSRGHERVHCPDSSSL